MREIKREGQELTIEVFIVQVDRLASKEGSSKKREAWLGTGGEGQEGKKGERRSAIPHHTAPPFDLITINRFKNVKSNIFYK